MKKIFVVLMVVTLMTSQFAWAKTKAKTAANASLGVSVVSVKAKGSWTEVVLALENKGGADVQFSCCKAFLENDDGFSVASLTQGEVRSQIHNKAKTAAAIGAIVGAGLGIGGWAGGSEEAALAGISVAGASAIGGIAGDASANKQARNIVIDDLMRNQLFPTGLKVAGVVYFPPKKKWPGSHTAKAIHVTYSYKGTQQMVTVPLQ